MARPTRDPKEYKIQIRMSDMDLEKLEECCDALSMSKTDVIKTGIEKIHENLGGITMKQKTFISNTEYAVGTEVILCSQNREGSSKDFYYCVAHKGAGIGGNLDHTQTRYHGWRGTTDGVERYAHGVRKVTRVVELGLNMESGEYEWKITVGADLHPEWD